MGILSGHKAFITGCNRGLGREILELFAKEGAQIVACSRHSESGYLEDLASVSDKYSVGISPVYMDLSDETSLKEGLRQVARDHKDLDVLINNAGIAYGAAFNLTSMAKLREVFEVDFFSQIAIMQQISRLMMKNRRGSIVNIASAGGIEANAGYLAYGSAKAALIFATRVLAREVGGYGIRVNALAPGLIDTSMGHYKDEKELEKMIERTPLLRMGRASEIARCALFLASDESSFVTGQVLRADGGR
ncbi:MAG: SDR family NAD(P)-dependent oxidoreductase [Succinatimonas hippei]|nr:SDR family NAD(P)-dependent oxidoreductase [Succinatimonas hippei]